MNLSDLASTVIKYGAGTLGGLLAGPAGAAAATALAVKFGANPDDADDIAQKIASDPNANEKILELERINLQRDQAFLADKGNAREMAIEMAKQGVNNKLPAHVAYSLISLLALIVFLLAAIIFDHIQVEEAILIQLGAISGFLTAKVGSIIDFFFGSSSEKKQH